MKNTIKNLLMASAVTVSGLFAGCTLDEYNPAGFTMESISYSIEGYESLVDNCYFGMERVLFGAYRGDNVGFMGLSDADSDLWTAKANMSTTDSQFFWFFGGAAPNTTYTNDYFINMYDGIHSCNKVIAFAANPPFATEEQRNAKVAEGYFMRAIYYFHLVEQFGATALVTEPQTSPNYAPMRVDPMTIYREVIIPDLQFAVKWLPKGDDTTMTRPTKKAALGYLAKACLQTKYYDTDEFLQTGLDAAKTLISDCEAGGANYNAYMYANIADVFAEANNQTNKEALWKTNWDPKGASNGNYRMNGSNGYFLCEISRFGARVITEQSAQQWESNTPEGNYGHYMPTQHLLSLYVQDDNTLDPRFHQWFSTEWKANTSYRWTADAATNYRKNTSIAGTELAEGDLAIKIVMPQDADYAAEIASKATSPYLLVDYRDVYDDAAKKVIDNYNGTENMLHYFYPSLNKHNSSNFYVSNASRYRLGNLNAVLIMRMAEVYLIAAELDIYLNGGSNAKNYIDKVRTRAGVKPLSGSANIRAILDERGRELCGEYTRFYDLKRTGMLKDASYLQETHPDLARYFNPNYVLRPVPTTFTATLSNGGEWQNPGY